MIVVVVVAAAVVVEVCCERWRYITRTSLRADAATYPDKRTDCSCVLGQIDGLAEQQSRVEVMQMQCCATERIDQLEFNKQNGSLPLTSVWKKEFAQEKALVRPPQPPDIFPHKRNGRHDRRTGRASRKMCDLI